MTEPPRRGSAIAVRGIAFLVVAVLGLAGSGALAESTFQKQFDDLRARFDRTLNAYVAKLERERSIADEIARTWATGLPPHQARCRGEGADESVAFAVNYYASRAALAAKGSVDSGVVPPAYRDWFADTFKGPSDAWLTSARKKFTSDIDRDIATLKALRDRIAQAKQIAGETEYADAADALRKAMGAIAMSAVGRSALQPADLRCDEVLSTRLPVNPIAQSTIDGVTRQAATPDFAATALLLRNDDATVPAVDDDPDQPWAAHVARGFKPHCTGTLVAPTLVVTAAHCLCGPPTVKTHADCTGPDAPKERWEARRRKVYFPSAGIFSVREVSPKHINPNYAFDGGGADTAVLLLSRPVRSIKPAPVIRPGKPALALGSDVWLIGFGKHYRVGAAPAPDAWVDAFTGIKLHGKAKTLACTGENPSDHVCLKFKSDTDFSDPSDISAGICQGDSGGPMIWRKNANSAFALAAVTSGTWGCTPGKLALHSEIAREKEPAFLGPWLDRAFAENTANPPAAFSNPLEPFLTRTQKDYARRFLVDGASGPLTTVLGKDPVERTFTVEKSQTAFRVSVNAGFDFDVLPPQSIGLTVLGPGGKTVCAAPPIHSTVLTCLVQRTTEEMADDNAGRTYTAQVTGTPGVEIQITTTAFWKNR